MFSFVPRCQLASAHAHLQAQLVRDHWVELKRIADGFRQEGIDVQENVFVGTVFLEEDVSPDRRKFRQHQVARYDQPRGWH